MGFEFNSDEFKKAMTEALKPAIIEAMRSASAAAALKAEARAKYYCPVDTGRLRASITHNYAGSGQTMVAEFTPKQTKEQRRTRTKPENIKVSSLKEPNTDREAALAIIGTNVEYARHIEYGTGRFGGVHYLEEGLREGAASLGKFLKSALARIRITKR